MLFAELLGDLTGTKVAEQGGQGLSKARAVRESARSNKFSRAISILPPGRQCLVPVYDSTIGRNRDAYELEPIVVIHPQGPLYVFSAEIQAHEFTLGAADCDLFFSDE